MAEIRDTFALQPVRSRVERFHGLRWTVRSDTVVLQDDQEVLRDIVVHTGAVGIVAINERDEILLNRQYRHPVGGYLWEPPAGLLDIADEDPLVCAQREFVEEAGLVAGSWSVLVDFFNSPGGSSEAFRCFLARDIREAPGGRPPAEGEETTLEPVWLPLDEALTKVLAGELMNPTAVTGILAASAAKQRGWADLRPADSPWPAREHLLREGLVRLDP
ncbi:MAG: NUDIX hydrolase [Actinobacteria bacterium]|nr:NUDIX hydrolase [Actinomycetota bacterium]